jgi:3-oxoacyl-[acyl-carrier protein] reductase
MENLSGKVAVVTGSSRGIGRGIAIELAKAGANVVINYKDDINGAENTKEIIKNISGIAPQIFQADVSIYAEANNLIEGAVQKFGKVDILVNNAGISKRGLLIDMTENDFDNIINSNVKSTFNCTHCVLKYMLEKKDGVIINISSMWGKTGASCEAIYSASKGAVNLFTSSLAKEMGPSNIRVNAIAPGVINTTMNDCLSVEEKESLKNEIPLMRFGEIEDIGKAVVFLSGENSIYITGQIISVDGAVL